MSERRPIPSDALPIVTLRFAIPDPQAPKNFRPTGRGNAKTWEAIIESERLQRYAVAARAMAGWPVDPWIARRVRLTLQAYGGDWDAGAFDTLTRDALQGVLYHDDRIVSNGPQDPAFDDGAGRRLEVFAELFEAYSPEEAARRRAKSEKAAQVSAAYRERKALAAGKPRPRRRKRSP